MNSIKTKTISLFLVFFLAFCLVNTINVDGTYAASKKTHLKKTTITLIKGESFKQKLISKKGKVIKSTKVKWKSKKRSVAKINKKGRITARKSGTAKMTAKYKGKTYKFKVIVKTRKALAVKHIHKYIVNNGVSVKKDYMLPCKKCIKSKPVYTTDRNGRDVKDIYIIGAKRGNKNVIYLSIYRTFLEDTKYTSDCIDRLNIAFRANYKTGGIALTETYYADDEWSRSYYVASGKMRYSKYTGYAYPGANGISNLTVGWDEEPVSDAWDVPLLYELSSKAVKGSAKLLRKKTGIRLEDIGFSKL